MVSILLTNLPENNGKPWKNFLLMNSMLIEEKSYSTNLLKNGNSYGSCFENDGIGIRQNYPYFDTEKNKVVTLEGALNELQN